ncbi:hydrogenase-2 operon protein HybE [mine drainage metagenome]|uniref:Hydrogenase-2 operon protein HybE n=1 Tax=mine drainage metagenome TaxID=410659 RepID=A0A1J5RJX0_9ZZZZ
MVWRSDPAEAIERAYARIERERFVGSAVAHPALRIEAVDVQPWHGHWLGALVTPWSLALLLLPGPGAPWRMPRGNARLPVRFPVGDIAFLGNEDVDLGEYLSAALFADMRIFASQADAVRAARDAIGALWAPVEPPPRRAQASRRSFLGLR